MSQPYVTVAMPCRNEAGFIEACLRSVQAQSYPRERIEILVADGGSTDGTREILARLAKEDDRIRFIDNPQRIQAAGLNHAIRAARGEVIARMDVHADYAPDYLEKCIEVLERTGADNVGGAARCRAKGSVQLAVCLSAPQPARVRRRVVPERGGRGLRRHAVPGGLPARHLRQGRALRRRSADQRGCRDQPAHPPGRRPALPEPRDPLLLLPARQPDRARDPVLPLRPGSCTDAAQAPPLRDAAAGPAVPRARDRDRRGARRSAGRGRWER